jgi:D-alanyl-D-alanine carboxypeptidase
MYRSLRQSAYRPLRQSAPPPGRQRTKRTAATLLLSATAVLVVTTATIFGLRHPTKTDNTTAIQPANNQQADQQADQHHSNDGSVGFSKQQYSTTDPASIWIVVNKQRPLAPKTYTPANLVVPNIPLRANITSNEKYVRADVAKALEKMVADAKAAGITLNLQSGYRSYNFQTTLYNSYVKSQGQTVADRQSARPGYSEHQTGLAADLGGTTQPGCNVEACYATTPEGIWLAANAYKYGFLVRYPADKEPVTGYLYEPWHIRYIGTALSTEMYNGGVETLEEFFGFDAAPRY